METFEGAKEKCFFPSEHVIVSILNTINKYFYLFISLFQSMDQK